MEKKNDLIERYLYDVSRYLPYKQKNDITNELRSIIDDMIEERCADIAPTEKDVRVVLTELGTPAEVGAEYGLGKQKSLISGIYFIKYKMFLKIILLAVAFGLSVSTFINIAINNIDAVNGIYSLLGDVFSVSVAIIGVMTIVFALLERKSVNIEEFTFESLPPVPKKQEKISMVETILSLALNILFTTILILAPNLIAFEFVFNNEILSVFNVEFIRGAWWIILIIGFAGITDDIIKIIDGRYTKRVMLTNIITGCITIVSFLYIFSDNNILTAEFVEYSMLTDFTANYIKFFPIVISIFVLIDMGITIYKTIKAEKEKNI